MPAGTPTLVLHHQFRVLSKRALEPSMVRTAAVYETPHALWCIVRAEMEPELCLAAVLGGRPSADV